MNISEFINELKEIQDQYGDISVEVLFFEQFGCCQDWECDFSDDIEFGIEYLGKDNPVLFIEGKMTK
jgi:hypothetical protein